MNDSKAHEAHHTYGVLHSFDTWSLCRSIKSSTYLGMIIFCLSLAGHIAYANEINEFDDGSDGWSIYHRRWGVVVNRVG